MAQDMTNDRAMMSERDMISEKVAPTLVGRMLNSFDLVVIFVALVLFITNASTVQFAGSAAFVFWGLGFLTFLIPGALVTAAFVAFTPVMEGRDQSVQLIPYSGVMAATSTVRASRTCARG